MNLRDYAENNKKTFYTVVICIVAALVIITGVLYYFIARTDSVGVSTGDVEVVSEVKEIVVHVKGGVYEPGVYTFPKGARVIDAIETAGGVGMNSDSLQSLNLAEPLKDGQEIIVPGVYFARPVNINTATVAELAQVPDIPKWLARDIVSYREEYGPYNSTDEILNILGVLASDYQLIKNYITTEDYEEGAASQL